LKNKPCLFLRALNETYDDMMTLHLSRRLVNIKEPITFSIGMDPAYKGDIELRIFPRYLESRDHNHIKSQKGYLAWLEGMPCVVPSLNFQNGTAQWIFTPEQPGNYIAQLRSRSKTLYRYFAAVTADYLVYRMEAYSSLQPPDDGPEYRDSGIPIDWAMKDQEMDALLNPSSDRLKTLLSYQEIFGDLVFPFFLNNPRKDDPNFNLRDHVVRTVDSMRKAGFPVDRVVCDWVANAKAVELYRQLGFDVVDGIIQEGEGHRGAPWFPYWMSENDFLTPAPTPTRTFGMIMDFCAGFHFHGPPDFHMIASNCNWELAEAHVDLAAKEHVLMIKNSSNGPVFVPTLLIFDYTPWGRWPKKDWPRTMQLDFSRNFVDYTAFVQTRKYPIVFARCTDIADYLREHPRPQPRRIMSSITHDWIYDRWWSGEWCNHGVDTFRDVLPFNDSLADIRRRRPYIWAKPTARELIYYEDDRHQCRFEFACPKPLLWYDYSELAKDPGGGRTESKIPDPKISLEASIDENSYEAHYQIASNESFKGYKLAIWDIPREYAHCPAETNAKGFFLVENSDGDYRGILVFDLESPVTSIQLCFRKCKDSICVNMK